LKRFGWILILAALCASVLAPAANAAFGIEKFDLSFTNADGSVATQAGSHPFAVTNEIKFNTTTLPGYGETPDGAVRNLDVNLPPGLVGRPSSAQRCSSADFINYNQEDKIPKCSNSSVVGLVVIKLHWNPVQRDYLNAPVYNLTPPPGVVQKLGFIAQGVPVTIEFTVNQKPPYNVVARLRNIAQPLAIFSSKLVIWGNPASPAHDTERGACLNASEVFPDDTIHTRGGLCPSGAAEEPYVTLPAVCDAPPSTEYVADSWQGEVFGPATFTGGTLAGCGKLGFSPSIAVSSTTQVGQSPSGLDFNLSVADEGLTSPTGLAQSPIRRTEVTLPEGMTVNASVVDGLGACSPADLDRETLVSSPGAGCPESSKIGTVDVETPLLEEPIKGNLYVAKPYDNEFGSLLGVYLVIKNPKLGVIVKQALKITADQRTGQLTAVADNIPQLPFSHFKLNFQGGARGPLTTPTGCGSYETKAVLFPWSGGPAVTSTEAFQITVSGAGGGCGPGPFKPSFEAGTVTPLAGTHSPFVLNLSRDPGSQRIASIDTTLPEGLLGKLAGLAECSEAQIAAARARSNPNQGALEIAAPSCPAASEVGKVDVGAGSGSLTYVQGRAYLAGPYRGAPLSLVIVTPAVAGPFDLGAVVVRNALYVDPTTAQIHAISDPLPSILEGIPLDIRAISVTLNRPNFTLNPTSCDPMAVLGGAASLQGQSVSLTDRFQVGGCNGLAFAPKLALSLTGQTKRTGNPGLKAVLTQPKGQANIGKVSVTLPRSQFIDNRHINNPCTRPQFNDGRCPPKSVLGRARAYTPLLDKPLQGKVYFRSNGGDRQLPDLVVALRGQIDVNLVGFIDSVRVKGSEASRVRSTFALVPDAPVSKVILELSGGKKGLLQNSVNLCKGRFIASVKMTGQNNKAHNLNQVLKTKCGGKGRKSAKR